MRIKVTGYIDTDDMELEDVDTAHPMGVSDTFYQAVATGQRSMPDMDDIEFKAEGD